MQLTKPFAVSALTRPIQYRGRCALALSALVLVDLAEDLSFLYAEASTWKFLAREFSQVPLVDEGFGKQHPEFLVQGAAFATDGSVSELPVRVRIGPIEKTLLVSGDRYWSAADHHTVPIPFSCMPLAWTNAYGGVGFDDNPIGKGAQPVDLNGMRARPLPNIEYPDRRVTQSGQACMPAGFSSLPLEAPARAQYRGTYDDAWLQNESPGLASDLDWRFFNMAPPDQWFPADLVGDEAIEIQNMHPEQAMLRGRLPGLRLRAFVGAVGDASAPLRESATQLKTVWLFPHAQRVLLIYQGLIPCAQSDGSDVGHLMLAVERLAQPKTDTHYQASFARRLDPVDGIVHALSDGDLLPAGIPSFDPELTDTTAQFQPNGFIGEAQARGASRKTVQLRAQLAARGLNPDDYGLAMPKVEKVPAIDELPAYLERVRQEAAQAQSQALAASKARQATVLALIASLGVDPSALSPRGPPAYRALGHLEALLAKVPAGTPGADGKPVPYSQIGPQLVQFELIQRQAYLAGAHHQAAAPAAHARVSDAARQSLSARLAAGESAAFEDMTGIDLRGLDLSEAAMPRSQLESANLAGCTATRVDLSESVLVRANLNEAVFAGAMLAGANLSKASVQRAVFDHANLERAILADIDLSGASLRRARLAGAQLHDTVFSNCDLSHADLAGQTFIRRALSATVLAGANLAGATFIECTLTGTNLARATLTGASFIGCDLQRACFDECAMNGVSFTAGCTLRAMSMRRSRLCQGSLRGADISEAQMQEAVLDGSDLSEVIAVNVNLERASLCASLLIRADLQGARASQANLMDAILQQADLRAADLSGANLFGADLSLVRANHASRLDFAVSERARVHPRRSGEALP